MEKKVVPIQYRYMRRGVTQQKMIQTIIQNILVSFVTSDTHACKSACFRGDVQLGELGLWNAFKI